MKGLARAEAELLDLPGEGPFRAHPPSAWTL